MQVNFKNMEVKFDLKDVHKSYDLATLQKRVNNDKYTLERLKSKFSSEGYTDTLQYHVVVWLLAQANMLDLSKSFGVDMAYVVLKYTSILEKHYL